MPSVVSICNFALVSLGADAIVSIDANETNARKCKALYEMVRDEELSDYNWKFSLHRVELAKLTTEPLFGWIVSYALPSDCRRAIKVSSSYSLSNDSDNFEINGTTVYCNIEPCFLKYQRNITDPNSFPSYFSRLLSARLAMELAYSITDNATLRVEAKENYNSTKKAARTADAQQGNNDSSSNRGFTWLEARRNTRA